MIRSALRLLSLPVTVPMSFLMRGWADRSLGKAGVIELSLGDEADAHPLLTLAALERAVERTNARGVLLHLRGAGGGWATLAEWREALCRFRESGRLIVASVEAPGNADMYLASAADRIIIAPAGEVAMVGIGGTLTFMGAALDKLGLAFEVESAGAYKSAGETLSRSFASAENREATQAILDDLHDELVEKVASGRGLSVEAVQALVDRAPLMPEEARDGGLVDALGYEDGVQELLEDLLGDKVRRLPLGAVTWKLGVARRFESLFNDWPAIAVVHMEGDVVMGDGANRSRQNINARTLPPILRQLGESDGVKAVVLQIRSPGGSALASDIIWRDVELLNRKKPVIAALGDVAASGGYYVAAPASEIVARPSTLTGSIGVVGGKLVTGGALAKLGVYAEQLSRGKNAGMYSAISRFDPEQRARFRERLKATYGTFLKRVAAGRRKPVDAIDEVAQGRVWSGRAARENGLVDRLGGLAQALERARVLTGIRPGQPWRRVDVVIKPPRRWLLSALPGLAAQLAAGELPARVEIPALAGALGVKLPKPLEWIAEAPGEPLALLPAELEIK